MLDAVLLVHQSDWVEESALRTDLNSHFVILAVADYLEDRNLIGSVMKEEVLNEEVEGW